MTGEFEDIKKIWEDHQPESLPDVQRTYMQIGEVRSQLARNIFRMLAQLLIPVVVCLALLITIDFQSQLTYIGICIMLAAMLLYMYFEYTHYRMLTADYSTLPAAEYLQKVRAQHLSRNKYATWGAIAYMLILFFGLALYLRELTSSLIPVYRIATYTALVAWGLFVYFVLNKRVRARERQFFEQIIGKLDNIAGQMEKAA
ncbi:MAG: hypothetical protein IPO27_07665 [Bacteroidetes bacterium]|nr:hypothetical protein [Bacteroidota bacterium]